MKIFGLLTAASLLAGCDQHAGAKRAVEDAVKEQLRDPSSAEFENVRAFGSPSMTTVCGTVNARNGFGGYAGRQGYLGTVNNGVVSVTVFPQSQAVDLCTMHERAEKSVG